MRRRPGGSGRAAETGCGTLSPMSADYTQQLKAAVEAATLAGEILLAEFHRPGGPRGNAGTCPADVEAERLIRERLGAAFPEYGLYAEELPELDRGARDAAGHVWAVDPNDGTRAYQRGWRGSAVSIGLLRAGELVLGVVFAYAARAGAGDLLAWAEGLPFTRNGAPVVASAPHPVGPDDTVFVSQAADRNPERNAEACREARFRAVPSVAYRLALAAAGEGVAAVSLGGPGDLDVAGGHALLEAVGRKLYRRGGHAVHYDKDGHGPVGDCFAGDPDFAKALASRDWGGVRQKSPDDAAAPLRRVWPDPHRIQADPGVLDRAQGCLIGQLAGDSLGGLVEFRNAAAIARAYGTGPRALVDGGHWGILAGQPTDDSELALMLARSLVDRGCYDQEAVAEAYAYWLESDPFDSGSTIHRALSAAARARRSGTSAAEAALRAAAGNTGSQANGALMRVAPLGIYGHAMEAEALAELARADARLTHAHAVCQDANAVFTVTIARAVRTGEDPAALYAWVRDWAEAQDVHADVRAALEAAATARPAEFSVRMGWVRIAFQNAFHELLDAGSAEGGICRTVAAGGDTDTNGAIAGALLGAAHGVNALPPRWVDRIVTCRPLRSLPAVKEPRPRPFWPVDALLIAEHLTTLPMPPEPSSERTS